MDTQQHNRDQARIRELEEKVRLCEAQDAGRKDAIEELRLDAERRYVANKNGDVKMLLEQIARIEKAW